MRNLRTASPMIMAALLLTAMPAAAAMTTGAVTFDLRAPDADLHNLGDSHDFVLMNQTVGGVTFDAALTAAPTNPSHFDIAWWLIMIEDMVPLVPISKAKGNGLPRHEI